MKIEVHLEHKDRCSGCFFITSDDDGKFCYFGYWYDNGFISKNCPPVKIDKNVLRSGNECYIRPTNCISENGE